MFFRSSWETMAYSLIENFNLISICHALCFSLSFYRLQKGFQENRRWAPVPFPLHF
uniref:Uncharacterized protein n=1 Tax=Anguilla anguilla TaxID=7936 RepID=A0A0E9XIA9_ANGAN